MPESFANHSHHFQLSVHYSVVSSVDQSAASTAVYPARLVLFARRYSLWLAAEFGCLLDMECWLQS